MENKFKKLTKMKFKSYIIAFMSIVAMVMFQSCSDDKDTSAKAVLASVSLLQFDGLSPQPATFTVVSDADWRSEVPEWMTVTPSSGHAGQTEVTITLSDNLRDGSLDNPRRGTAVFRGNSLRSVCEVVVRQDGDKFRDIKSYAISEIGSVSDETVVEVKQVTVAAVGAKSIMVTDGKDNLLVMDPAQNVVLGDKLDIQGEKQHETSSMPYILGEKMLNVTSGTAPEINAQDITSTVDTYKSATRTPITVTGFYDAGYLNVDGKDGWKIAIFDAPAEFLNADLNAHDLTLTGYYCGTASPVVNMFVSSFEDKGLREVIYFFDDFEWLEEWAIASSAGSSVENNDVSANSPGITGIKLNIDGTEMSLFDYTEQVKGYKFVYDKNDKARTYLNRNYFKFGKTGNHSGITLPSIDVEAGTPLILQFDWSGMRQGSGKIDPVHLYVEVNCNGAIGKIDVPELNWENDHPLEWVRAEVDLSDYKIDKNSTITITQTEWEVSTANRWFLDNVKVKLKD